MTADPHAMEAQIREAIRQMDLAESKIREQYARILALEEENQRLRSRLASFGERMRRMEQGEL